MSVDPLTGLPAALVSGFAGAVVSGLLSLFSPLILQVPGFRANDASRNALMRVLVFALTLAAMIGLAWSQGIALPQTLWPAVVLYAAGGSALAHLVYSGAKASGGASGAGPLAPVSVEHPAGVGGPVVPFTAPAAAVPAQ